MLKKIWKMILNNCEDYELLNNGLEIDGCEYGYYYFNRRTSEYVTIGLDEKMRPKYIQFEK